MTIKASGFYLPDIEPDKAYAVLDSTAMDNLLQKPCTDAVKGHHHRHSKYSVLPYIDWLDVPHGLVPET